MSGAQGTVEVRGAVVDARVATVAGKTEGVVAGSVILEQTPYVHPLIDVARNPARRQRRQRRPMPTGCPPAGRISPSGCSEVRTMTRHAVLKGRHAERCGRSGADDPMPERTAPASIDELFGEFVRSRSPELRDRLVVEHLGMAYRLARRFAHRGEANEDLAQVAAMALVMAVDRFDPNRGVKFATFATRTICGELKRHFRDKGWAIKVSRRVQELYLELAGVVPELSQSLGRSPTVAELASATGTSEEGVLEAIEAGRDYRPASIDAGDGDREAPIIDSLGEADPGFTRFEDNSVLKAACDRLPERERLIVYLRFARSMTQTEIAREVGISQMHVSRVLAESLRQLREEITLG